MESTLVDQFPKGFEYKIRLCDVGPDVYGNARQARLIDTVWRWVRTNAVILGIEEHDETL
jgi:hypothetical protein